MRRPREEEGVEGSRSVNGGCRRDEGEGGRRGGGAAMEGGRTERGGVRGKGVGEDEWRGRKGVRETRAVGVRGEREKLGDIDWIDQRWGERGGRKGWGRREGIPVLF